MATKTTILDDLDGTEGATTRRYSVAGRQYEIDLSDENEEKLIKSLNRFITKSRDVTPVPRTPAYDPYAGIDQSEVRAWAVANGKDVNEKGRVSLDLVYAYKRALAEAEDPEDTEESGGDEDPSATQPEPPQQEELVAS